MVEQKVQRDMGSSEVETEYLQAVRDPLCPNKQPAIASLQYGDRELCFFTTVVFVEIPDALGTYDKQDKLVCSHCRSGCGNPLIIPAKNAVLPCATVDPGEETQKLPAKKVLRLCQTCRFQTGDFVKESCKGCNNHSQWEPVK